MLTNSEEEYKYDRPQPVHKKSKMHENRAVLIPFRVH